MYVDVVDLRDFYETRLGQVARRMIRRRIRLIWPDLRGMRLLGLGYATPYLRLFGSTPATIVVNGPNSITATAPPGTGTVGPAPGQHR